MFKDRYKSKTDDIVHDFYIPVLSQARCYCRVSGYFSTAALNLVATGISNFVENGEKM